MSSYILEINRQEQVSAGPMVGLADHLRTGKNVSGPMYKEEECSTLIAVWNENVWMLRE